MPNGEHTRSENVGSINLSSDLVLDDVLHVPKFRVNLICESINSSVKMYCGILLGILHRAGCGYEEDDWPGQAF